MLIYICFMQRHAVNMSQTLQEEINYNIRPQYRSPAQKCIIKANESILECAASDHA